MTLATVPRYDRTRVTRTGDRAVVVGAGVAGLLAARVLADAFAEVVVLDGDRLPDEPSPRRGVPQDRHPHALLEAGRATVADLLPGSVADVVSVGGVVTDFAGDVEFYTAGGFLARGPARMETVSATRPLLEYTLRTHVAGIDAVRIRESRHCAGYLLADAGTAVEGVRVREGSAERELRADLVVDATGRASATPAWLDRNGYEPPPVEAVRIGVVYSTTYVERPPDDRWTCLVPPSPPRRRGGMVAPVEGDRWVVTLSGVHGETPPTDPEGFRAYAASLPVPELGHLLDDQPPAARIEHYPFPENRRRRYESVARFPDGLLVVGDAVASFNPVYAQGMSVAALEALALHHALADGTADLAARFFDRSAAVVDVPWNLAAGADFGFPETTGPRPRGTAFLDWYLGRLVRRAHADGILTDAFLRVLTMERHPASLFRPGVLRRVLVPRLRGRGSEPRTGRRGGAEPPATGRRDEESGSPVVDRRASAED